MPIIEITIALRSGMSDLPGRCRPAMGYSLGGVHAFTGHAHNSAERQIDILNLSGGEPLLHPELIVVGRCCTGSLGNCYE